jgi:hypothetical protein
VPLLGMLILLFDGSLGSTQATVEAEPEVTKQKRAASPERSFDGLVDTFTMLIVCS